MTDFTSKVIYLIFSILILYTHINLRGKALRKNICSWGYDLLENRICVITKSLESSPGKFDLFLWYFFHLESLIWENWMRSCRILRKLSWKIYKCVFTPFLVVLENLMCSYKRIMSPPGKFICLLNPSLLENLVYSRNRFKKVAPEKNPVCF